MAENNGKNRSFEIRDCALAAIATGHRVRTLRELRDSLREIHPDCIYYHFWGGLLRPRFDDPEYNNDFAAWVKHGLHDPVLAERLGIIDPIDFNSLEDLRAELIDVIEERLDQTESISWATMDKQFHFIRSQIVVFHTGRKLKEPAELVDAVPGMSLGSVFFHFVDARRRTWNRIDDIRSWLEIKGEKYESLRRDLAAVDPFFNGLVGLRTEIGRILRDHLGEGTG